MHRRDLLKSGASAAAWLALGHPPLALGGTQLTPGGTRREFSVRPAPTTVPVGTTSWPTWAYNGRVPGPEIRVMRGDRVRIVLDNALPADTTIHWHGLPVPPAMDGVPGLSQAPVPPGGRFVYEFDASVSGTFFYHSHVGLQLDRGLYGALIVEEPGENDRLHVGREYVLVLDDWLTGSPEEALPSAGGMMGGGPFYDGYLLNGTVGPTPFMVRAGERVRLRLVNAAAATVFRFGIDGHRLTVTHADGQPVESASVSTLAIGMGERYDIMVTADRPGTWPILVSAAGSVVPRMLGVLAYDGADRPASPPFVWPAALQQGPTLRYANLRPTTAAVFDFGGATTIPIILSGGLGGMFGGTAWTINGQRYPAADPFLVRDGTVVALAMTNRSMMPHPMHLHGHMGWLRVPDGWIAKDTVLVNPMESLTLAFTADNPGRWLFHCHNAYHMELGMARVIEYR